MTCAAMTCIPAVSMAAPAPAAASAAQPAPRVSVVVIGRNEGERLRRCLAAIHAAAWDGMAWELIYVDSRSTDQSLDVARSFGAATVVVAEDPCAAKARNLGWQRATGEFILFLDGDTELHPGFVGAAMAALQDAGLCAAWGHRRESRPGQSVFTRVLDLDWVYPAGPSLYFGGDVLVRRAALAQVGGFDPSLAAGEEPELCARLRAAGWRIEHLDVPMTRHDLAVRTWRAYARRCWRSGVAYAEVADRARRRGDSLWQRESVRDLVHGFGWLALAPVLLVLALVAGPAWSLLLPLAAGTMIVRSAWRARWKAPGRPGLLLAYAIHSQVQKVPALGGQLAWRWAHLRGRSTQVAGYKEVPASQWNVKAVLAAVLAPATAVAAAWRRRSLRLWSFARLQRDLGRRLDPGNVVLGPVEVEGSGNVTIGTGALIHGGVVLETQGPGRIVIGDRVVLSRGVHIVAFDHVSIGDDCMVGEYTSIRDANHRPSSARMRDSGHDAAPVVLERNVWIGRGAAVLKGVHIGDSAVVAANAVVTRSLPSGARARGIPARNFQGAAA